MSTKKKSSALGKRKLKDEDFVDEEEAEKEALEEQESETDSEDELGDSDDSEDEMVSKIAALGALAGSRG